MPGFGLTVNGARRWLNLGFIRFQPSEFAKLTLILYLITAFYKEKTKTHFDNLYNAKKAFWITIITTFLVFLGKDLSTSVFILSFYGVASIIAGKNVKTIVLSSLFAASGLAIYILTRESFRSQRIQLWLNYVRGKSPIADQLKNAILSLSKGGFLGVGFGESGFKTFLPEAHTDFIFPVLGEEMGFVFLLLLILLYTLFLVKLVILAKEAKYEYELYLFFLGGYFLGGQALINMGVTIGLLPITGVTLPLISYGRTSFIIFVFLIAIFRSVEKDIIRRTR